MLRAKKTHIVIRPTQPLHWLAVFGFIALGIISAKGIYHNGVWLFALAYTILAIGFLCDRIVYDGTRLRRVGPGAWLLSLLGKPRELALKDIEAASSYATRAGGDCLLFRTVITGKGIYWRFKSNEASYRVFIKSIFKALNPHLLDLLSTELLLYWGETPPPFKPANQHSKQHIERWRHKAITLSLDGYFEAADSYFKIALENAPDDPQISYDIGRFLRRRALARGKAAPASKADLSRAENYLRMAGRLARSYHNARLLEKVGEAFYESYELEAAQRYFELATFIEPVRPRANIGLAGIALQNAQGVRAIHAYAQAARGATSVGATGLAQFIIRKSDYYQRLISDNDFLKAETGWDGVLTQLKWGRRVTLALFLLSWPLQLHTFAVSESLQKLSLEVSATALILWLCTFVISQIILAYRRN